MQTLWMGKPAHMHSTDGLKKKNNTADSNPHKVCTRATVYCRNYDIHRIILFFFLLSSHILDILLCTCVWCSSSYSEFQSTQLLTSRRQFYSGFLLSLFSIVETLFFSTSVYFLFYSEQKPQSKSPIIEKWTHLSSIDRCMDSIFFTFI